MKEPWAIGGLASCSQNWKEFPSNALVTVKSDWNVTRNSCKGLQGEKENKHNQLYKDSDRALLRCLTETGKQNKDQTDAEIHATLKKVERQGSPDSPEVSDIIHGGPKEKICLYVLIKLYE